MDISGVHDRVTQTPLFNPANPYEQAPDYDEAVKTAWSSSPVSAVDTWTSPVLIIHADDDRNVRFQQTVDLARRLEERNVPFEELVLPNEIHGFLRHDSWIRADEATANFLTRALGVTGE